MDAPSKARSHAAMVYCDVCKELCDRGTHITIVKTVDSNVEERIVLCSDECHRLYGEKELLDHSLDRAIRDERSYLHSKVCPACKNRIRRTAKSV